MKIAKHTDQELYECAIAVEKDVHLAKEMAEWNVTLQDGLKEYDVFPPLESAEAWQIRAIEEAVKEAKSKDAVFIEHERVAEWLNSWGTENQTARPH